MPGTIRIAGAGLAGLTAAALLAKAGLNVEVYDKKTRLLPSSGPHTEGIRNYGLVDAVKELGTVGFDLQPFGTVRHTIRYSQNFQNVLSGPAYYLYMRGRERHTVDQTLYRLAKELGVRFTFGRALDPSEADILATGPPEDRFNILGAGYTFTAEGSNLPADTVHALLDNAVAPGGYLVITPGLGFHSIYSVSWTELRFDHLLPMTEAAFQIPWIRQILGSSHWVSKIYGRAFYLEDPISNAVRGTSLVVGEAGGFQDAIAGFGFRHAVLTGGLAARAIFRGEDFRELLKAHFGREFADAFAFRTWLNRASNDDFDRLIASMGSTTTLQAYLRQRGSRAL